MSLDVQFLGDQKIVATLRGMGPKGTAAAKSSITRSTMKVNRLAKEKAPVGSPTRGDKHPGTLRRAINPKVTGSGTVIVGTVGIKLTYAAAHEFGFHGTVTVPAHLRMMRVAWGRPVANPRQIMVGTHPMQMNIKERSYLRAALRELRSDIIADLQSSVAKAVRE
jgi:phage gpG-like protein